MKILKKISFLLLLLTALMFSGCDPVPEGFGDVKKARDMYEKLDSAKVVTTDNISGERLMSFSFYINGKDEMVFVYENEKAGERAYSDGKQFFYKTSGSEEAWRAITPKNEEYIYNIYNRKYRYPYARGAIFFLDGASVKRAEIADDGDFRTIVYEYDCELLNERTENMPENVSSFSEFSCAYKINSDGYIEEFTEKGSVTDADGNRSEIDVTVEIMDMNGIDNIENPVDYISAE